MTRRFAVCVLTILVAVGAVARAADPPKKVRIAVLADSLADNSKVPWPAVLQKHLGDGYEVKVFSANGITVLNNTYRDLWRRYEYVHARDYRGDITLIALGANGAKPGNWRRHRDWKALYTRLIGMYKGENRKVYLVLPPPAVTKSPYGISREILHKQTIPAMKQLAKDTGSGIIDSHTPLLGRTDVTLDDGLYPNPLGHEIIGKVVYMALTGKKVDIPPPPKPKTQEEISAENAAKAVKAPHVLQLKVGETTELKAEYVADPKGDGPDGKGNTEDDTWQFWFELAHARSTYHRLDLPTATMSATERKAGRPGKVTGPVGSWMPNSKDTEGWIYHSDWDGRGEGIWGDRKAKAVMAHPYVEKNSHCCLAISFRVPADGEYDVSATLTDVAVAKFPQMTGIVWRVEISHEWTGGGSPEAYKTAAKGGPIGDGKGPDSGPVAAKGVAARKGNLIRLVIDPNKNWGSDMTKIEQLRIKRVK